MKVLNIILLLLLQLSCCNKLAYQETSTFPVKIKEVYFQNWVAGVRGGGSGTNFHLEFEQELPTDIILNQVYFRGNKAVVQKNSETQYVIAFHGTANLRNNEELVSDVPPVEVKKIEAPIPISDDEAVLEFTQKGKLKHYKIKNVTRKEMLAYPSVRPRN